MIERGLCGIRQKKGALLKSFVSTVRHVFACRCFCLHTLNEQDIDVSLYHILTRTTYLTTHCADLDQSQLAFWSQVHSLPVKANL